MALPALARPRNLAATSVEELLRGCREGRESAWEEFLRRYGDLIYSTIRRRAGLTRAEDREDAFQNAVLSIYKNLADLRDFDKIVPWMVRIAYTQGIDTLRMRKKLQETPIDDLSESSLNEVRRIEDPAPPAEEMYLALERAQAARQALSRLPERCRLLIRLLFYEDPPLDYAEVARRAALPIGSIGPTRARCLEKMRRILADASAVVSERLPVASGQQKDQTGTAGTTRRGGRHE
ncbi:MAG: sigma-70 family RNA polymerase sigma factor [Candidatus Eisenbacteria bacterium]|nr:sigma-70 family RNA polymerase sigma factor [Candidatus Eisenbacteria bacterium]